MTSTVQQFPHFECLPGKTLDTMLEDLAVEGLKNRLLTILAKHPGRITKQQDCFDRLHTELDNIRKAKLSGYLLVVIDYVRWAKDQGIPIGPGRGAFVGSLVAFATNITDLDPLQYNLLFERFLNTGHHVIPEIFIDFCQDRQQEVLQYVSKKYGRKFVKEFGPIIFNFRGLKALTVNNKAVQLIRADKSPDFDLAALRDDDSAIIKLISLGKTKYIFQFECSGMRDFLKQLKPTCFEDLIAALALFRPGPIESGMVYDVIERKHGRRKIIYDLPQMEPILNNTYGVIVYQEQIMQIIHDIAGYSLEEADMLRRRLIGKKNVDVEKDRFLVGTDKQGISAEIANLIFERMVLYADHTFIKAHAAAYATISYQSAYIKVHYPEEFETAVRSQPK